VRDAEGGECVRRLADLVQMFSSSNFADDSQYVVQADFRIEHTSASRGGGRPGSQEREVIDQCQTKRMRRIAQFPLAVDLQAQQSGMVQEQVFPELVVMVSIPPPRSRTEFANYFRVAAEPVYGVVVEDFPLFSDRQGALVHFWAINSSTWDLLSP